MTTSPISHSPLYFRFIRAFSLPVWIFVFVFFVQPAFSEVRGADSVRRELTRANRVAVLVKLRGDFTRISSREARGSAIRFLQEKVLSRFTPDELTLGYRYKWVPGFSGWISAEGLEKIEQDDRVESISPDRKVYASLIQSRPLINADDVENTYHLTGKNVTVALLDTGIQTAHPLLENDVAGTFTFLNGASTSGADDDNGHGTHVAGIITSTGDTSSFLSQVGRGIAPDAKILALKTLAADGSGSVSDQIAGLEYVVDQKNILTNLKVVNLSFGTDGVFSTFPCDGEDANNQLFSQEADAVYNEGIVLFAASGNNGSTSGLPAPACFSHVVSVGAVYDASDGRQPPTGTYSSGCFDASAIPDRITCFTNRTANLDLLAPGAQILSTSLGGKSATLSGTSQASPHAAGVAALMLQVKSTLSPDSILSLLKSSGKTISDSGVNSYPRVDALAAIQQLFLPLTPTATPTGPTPTRTPRLSPTPTRTPTSTPTPTRVDLQIARSGAVFTVNDSLNGGKLFGFLVNLTGTGISGIRIGRENVPLNNLNAGGTLLDGTTAVVNIGSACPGTPTPTPTPTGTPPVTPTPTRTPTPAGTPTNTPTPSSSLTVRYPIPSGTDTSTLQIVVFNNALYRWVPLSNLTIDNTAHTITGTLSFYCPSVFISGLPLRDSSVPGDILFSLATGDLYVSALNPSGAVLLWVLFSVCLWGLFRRRGREINDTGG